MTIKKRLYISNILMIVVPIIVSIVVLVAGALITFKAVTYNNGPLLAELQFHKFYNELTDRTEKLLIEKDAEESNQIAATIESLLGKNNAQLYIYQGDKLVKHLGSGEDKSVDDLIRIMSELGGEGSVSIGSLDLECEKVLIEGVSYSFYLANQHLNTDYSDVIDIVENMIVFAIAIVLLAVFLTSRYLSRYVLKKIEDPLDILAAGVGEIRDGNLDYRIDYDGKNEFTPICQDFNEMAERLKASVVQTQKEEGSRKELLAGISHDLRTPLTSINAYVGGILDGVANTPEKQRQYLETISKKAMEINDMVEQLFLFSKLDIGEYPVNLEKLDIHDELVEMIKSNTEEYKKKGLELKLGKTVSPATVYADPAQLCNVFSNIMSNSLKYKEKDRGTLTLSCRKEAGKVIVSMEDDGPGVEEQALQKLFNTFYRCDPARKNSNTSSGLGLAICAKTLERMSGTIHAENAEAGGLRLIITLPEYKEGESR